VALNHKVILDFSREMETNHESGTELFIQIQSEIKRTEFITDRMPYLTPRGNWCEVIVLNVHTSAEDKTDDRKNSLITMS
jgi:hypothetical protein